jgi:energy-coupling factor transport system substrate-specific component
VLVLTLGGVVLRSLRRAVRRAAFLAPVAFTDAPEAGRPRPASE